MAVVGDRAVVTSAMIGGVGRNVDPFIAMFTYPIIERLRREQRNARRRIVPGALVRAPTVQWLRTEYRVEMRLLNRPLRAINSQNVTQMHTDLITMRQQMLLNPPPHPPPPGPIAPTTHRATRTRRRTRNLQFPTVAWIRATYRREIRQLSVNLRSITTTNSRRWLMRLRFMRRRQLDLARPIFEQLRFPYPRAVQQFMHARRMAMVRSIFERLRNSAPYDTPLPTVAWVNEHFGLELRELERDDDEIVITNENILRWTGILTMASKSHRRMQRNIMMWLRAPRPPSLAYPLDELADVYEKIVENYRLPPSPSDRYVKLLDAAKPHRIILRSAVMATRPIVQTVSNTWHGTNWLKQIANDDTEIDSKGNWWNCAASVPGLKDWWSAFAECYIEIEHIDGGCVKNQTRASRHQVMSFNYQLNTFSPYSQYNNCGLECLRHIASQSPKIEIQESNLKLRKRLNIPVNTFISVDDLLALSKQLMPDRPVVVLTTDVDIEIDMNVSSYILLHEHHYSIVESAVYLDTEPVVSVSKRRGVMAVDFETRRSFKDMTVIRRKVKNYATGLCEEQDVKSERIIDTICHARYTQHGDRTDLESWHDLRHIAFTTNDAKTSARQFLDWLINEATVHNRVYQLNAYNGSRFDWYLLLGAMTCDETRALDSKLHLRNSAIIGFEFHGHLFKDLSLFIPGSLEHNCEAYKVNISKMTTFTLDNGVKLNNTQLCFYKPHLDYPEFLSLQDTEPDFWRLYNEYCDRDCSSLYDLWKCFRVSLDRLIMKLPAIVKRPSLMSRCRMVGANTVGAYTKKVLNTITNQTLPFNQLEAFLYGHPYERDWTHQHFYDSVRERYRFICRFKRGGISHVNQAGLHRSAVACYDIVSQYSLSLKHMKVPVGASMWVKVYLKDRHGFYEVKQLRFRDGHLKRFRPIAYQGPPCPRTGVVPPLDWAHHWDDPLTANHSQCIDSQMLDYLMTDCGLESFEVVRGLVSKDFVYGESLFGDYVDVVFAEKSHQDELRELSMLEYNPALREVAKLMLNTVTGKLNEDPSKYYRVVFGDSPDGRHDKELLLNGVTVHKVYTKCEAEPDNPPADRKGRLVRLDGVSSWVTAGVCIYSHSKILLFKYINLLPDRDANIIHVETDGFYFSAKHNEAFQQNLLASPPDMRYPLANGSALGNVKFEAVSVGDSYWLAKKMYYYEKNCADGLEEVIKIKGVPKKSITDDGSIVKVVSRDLYERVYNMQEVPLSFATLTKQFYGPSVQIRAHQAVRTVRPLKHGYREYS